MSGLAGKHGGVMTGGSEAQDRDSRGRLSETAARPTHDLIGWREWVALPALGIPAIKAKADTGARTSALHAFSIEPLSGGNGRLLRIGVHPLQKRRKPEIHAVVEAVDRRWIADSGGHGEYRYVINTPIRLGDTRWNIEITLTDRETMLFRMLLGRSAIRDRFIVDAGRSFCFGRPAVRKLYSMGQDRATHPRPGKGV